jgi:hypothetical protein
VSSSATLGYKLCNMMGVASGQLGSLQIELVMIFRSLGTVGASTNIFLLLFLIYATVGVSNKDYS